MEYDKCGTIHVTAIRSAEGSLLGPIRVELVARPSASAHLARVSMESASNPEHFERAASVDTRQWRMLE